MNEQKIKSFYAVDSQAAFEISFQNYAEKKTAIIIKLLKCIIIEVLFIYM